VEKKGHLHLKHHLWKALSEAEIFSSGYTVLLQISHLGLDMLNRYVSGGGERKVFRKWFDLLS
jgi:hypothetical protein